MKRGIGCVEDIMSSALANFTSMASPHAPCDCSQRVPIFLATTLLSSAVEWLTRVPNAHSPLTAIQRNHCTRKSPDRLHIVLSSPRSSLASPSELTTRNIVGFYMPLSAQRHIAEATIWINSEFIRRPPQAPLRPCGIPIAARGQMALFATCAISISKADAAGSTYLEFQIEVVPLGDHMLGRPHANMPTGQFDL
jgi:hypothetical protein